MKRNILYTEKSFKEVQEAVQYGFDYQGLYQVVNDDDTVCVELNSDELGCYYLRLYRVDSENWISDDNFDSDVIVLSRFNSLDELFEDMEKHL